MFQHTGIRVLPAVMLGSVFLAAGILTGPVAAGARKLAVVQTGEIPAVTDVAYYAAMDKGYFQSEGIKVVLQRFASGAKMVAPLATGDISVAGGGVSAALFNSIAQGLDFKVVADKGEMRPGRSCCDLLVVRPDLLHAFRQEGLHSLQGKTVGLYAKASVNDYGLAQMLKSAGMTMNDVKPLFVSPPNMITAFATSAIAAGVVAEPWGARAEQEKVGVRVLQAASVPGLKNLQIAVIMFSGKFIRRHYETAQGWIKAYVRGISFFNERGLKNDEVAQIISHHTKLPTSLIKKAYSFYLSPDGKPNERSLTRQRDWFYKMGYSKTEVPMSKVVDFSFLKN